MAELNWIPKEERLPTAEDANEDQLVYAICGGKSHNSYGRVKTLHWKNVGIESYQITHWLPFREMPVPKRWRVPTIHDLAKAGKSMPCRVKNAPFEAWNKSKTGGLGLHAINVAPHTLRRFLVDEAWYEFCEICDD